ncbi:MAG: DUF3237 domain-containing protein [bacterium]|jgi:hypothetical protein
MLRLEPLFRATITLAPPQELGGAPLGRRRIIPITGGRIEGERLRGTVLPGGADWQIVRSDGVADLDARYTVQSDDGALIYVSNRGLRHGAPEVLARLASGDEVDPAEYYMRTQPWFETGDARYAWLNRTICVGTGARRRDRVELEFFAVL